MVTSTKRLRTHCIAGCVALALIMSCGVPDYKLWPLDAATGGVGTGGTRPASGGSSNVDSAALGGSSLPGAGTNSGLGSSETDASGGTSLTQNTTTHGIVPFVGGAPTFGGTSGAAQVVTGGNVSDRSSPASGGASTNGDTSSSAHAGGAPVNPSDTGSSGGSAAAGGAAAGGAAVGGAAAGGAAVGGAAAGGAAAGGSSSDTHVTNALDTGGVSTGVGGTFAGGQVTSGGTLSTTGGNEATGGMAGTGGTTNKYCQSFTDLGEFPGKSNISLDVPIAATCYRFTVTDLMAQVQGFGLYGCDTRKGTLNGVDCTSGCTLSMPIDRTADGYWYVDLGDGKSSNCKAQWWWY